MSQILEINNLEGCNFDEKKLKLTLEKTIQEISQELFSKKDVSVSLVFVSEKEIAKINKKYRAKDYPTDILSFANFDSWEDIEKSKEVNIFLGEIIMCPEDIKKYCQKKNIFFEYEFCKVLSHGVLHLLGLGHGKKMFAIQNKISTEVNAR